MARPRPTSATSTMNESAAAVAFSQPRANDPIAGTRIKVVNAIRVISPAPAKIITSADMPPILPQVDDNHGDRREQREDRDSECPAAADVAHPVDAEVDAT